MTTDKPETSQQPVTLSQLIEEPQFKTARFEKEFGCNSRAAWKYKRDHLDRWTVEEIKILAKMLRKTPTEIFQALYWETQQAFANEVPSEDDIDE